MSKNIRITEPSAEMLGKIIRAREAIAAQKPRYIKCPYREMAGRDRAETRIRPLVLWALAY